jgi:alpha-tubulin suppressor-like RCC1 family protein
LKDIIIFLEENQLKVPRTTKAIYDLAWETISENEDSTISPLSIKDFILAYNHQENLNQSYKTSTLLLSSDDQLRDLSNLVGLSVVRKDRLIRILGYLNLLINDVSTFDTLPKDALWIIGSNLDCRTITTFRLISKRFAELFTDQEIVEMRRIRLHRDTSLDLTTYTKSELDYLCLLERNKGRIAVGKDFYLVIFNPNQVGSWGRNDCGQLGNGKVSNQITKRPKIISGLTNIKAVAAGSKHSLALDYQGKIYGFGRLYRGQSKTSGKPTLIAGLEKIVAIYAQGKTSLFLDYQGQVYRLGNFSEEGLTYIKPTLIEIGGVVAASLDKKGCLLLTRTGQVFGLGHNYNHRLGTLENIIYHQPMLIRVPEKIISLEINQNYSWFLNNQGEVFALGDLGDETRYSEDGEYLLPIRILALKSKVIAMTSKRDSLLVQDIQGRTIRINLVDIPMLNMGIGISLISESNPPVGIQYIFDTSSLFFDKNGNLRFSDALVPILGKVEIY